MRLTVLGLVLAAVLVGLAVVRAGLEDTRHRVLTHEELVAKYGVEQVEAK